MTAASQATDLFGEVAETEITAGRVPALMADWTDILADELVKGNGTTDPQAARRLAMRLVARVCREYGGTYTYIPKGDALDRAIRDAQIWADYDGTANGPRGVAALARRENVSAVHIYRILEQQRTLHRRKIQPELGI